jgi:capsular polysaccharide biosynthesis protein
MDYPTFVAALKRAWLPALAAVVAAVVGAVVYSQHRILPSAQASVAVRDPLSVNTAQSAAAAVPFDAIIKSDRLAEMVAPQLGPSVGNVKGAVSVSVVLPQSGINISPLYVVHAKAPTEARAKEIVTAAIKQGQKLYAELNSVDPKQVTAALEPELQAANVTLAAVTKSYNDLVARTGGDQSAQINAVSSEVSALTTQVGQARANLAVAAKIAPPAATAARVQADGLQSQLDAAQRQLTSLEAAQGEYGQAAGALAQAQTSVRQLTDLEQQAVASSSQPIANEVKILDGATAESKGVLQILVYALGVVLGLLAAFSVIYFEAVRQRRGATPEQIVATLGVPVLGRIPRHALAREV